MTSVSASAPGKAVLSGEYAVLRTAPAISTAVDRRAVVRLVTSANDFHSIATPGHAEGTWRFRSSDAGEINWLDEPPARGLALIEEAWLVAGPCEHGGLSIIVDTSDFFAGKSGGKLGLGSSAAAMTALVGALRNQNPEPKDIGVLAGRAHTAMQHGLGSGVDIATSVHGGVIEFRSGKRDTPLHRPWPVGLCYRFLWSGKPADTMKKISKLESSGTVEKGWQSLLGAAEEAASVWTAGDVSEILDVFRCYTDTLREFSIDHDLGIFDAGHDGLADLAGSLDVVYKPCGAGGGDIGIVMASDDMAISRFCDQVGKNGFQELDVAPDQVGITISVGDDH
jgi:phosphomevalonate kinase